MMKTENEMIGMFPNYFEISAQDEASCAEACLVAAKAILCRNGMVTKEQFRADLSRIYLDRLKNENSIGPRDLPSLKRQAQDVLGLDTEIINLSDMDTSLENDSLALVRLNWAKSSRKNESHRFIDDEHYVLIYGQSEDTIFFWEPSFSFNGKKSFTEQLAKFRRVPAHISYSSPFWTMPKDEFLERVHGATKLSSSKGSALFLKVYKSLQG
jgi:hypothetical protein